MPDIPQDDDEEDEEGVRRYYFTATGSLAAVAKYANMSIPDVMRLELIDYMILRKDAFIQTLSASKKGLEALEAAWMKEQTKADRVGLRKLLGQKK